MTLKLVPPPPERDPAFIAARSARGMRECDACAGWGGPVLSDADCDTCDGTGEVPL